MLCALDDGSLPLQKLVMVALSIVDGSWYTTPLRPAADQRGRCILGREPAFSALNGMMMAGRAWLTAVPMAWSQSSATGSRST